MIATLTDAGCDVESIAVHSQLEWGVHIPGAPAQVNAPFPPSIPAGTPFFVRCRDAAPPAVDPANATYRIEADDVTLVDGRLEVPVAPGSATQTVTVLSARRAYGELAGAGAADAGVVVTQDPGGSGTFYYLAALRGSAGAGAADTVFLGDRIIVDDVSVAHGRLTVSYLVRRPSEPFAATPTVPVRRSFVLENDSLIEVGSGACEAGDLDQIGSFVFVTAPHGGARVRSGFAVTGCSRTFESNVNWRLLDRVGAEIASGFAIGGGRLRPLSVLVHGRVLGIRGAGRPPRGLRGRRVGWAGLPATAERDPGAARAVSPRALRLRRLHHRRLLPLHRGLAGVHVRCTPTSRSAPWSRRSGAGRAPSAGLSIIPTAACSSGSRGRRNTALCRGE